MKTHRFSLLTVSAISLSTLLANPATGAIVPYTNADGIKYGIEVMQGIGDTDHFKTNDTFGNHKVGTVGLKSYEDPKTPSITHQGWTHTSYWVKYTLEGSQPARVTFTMKGDGFAQAAPAFTVYEGADTKITGFGNNHAYLPDPKTGHYIIRKDASGNPTGDVFDPRTWPRDQENNLIFFPLYAANENQWDEFYGNLKNLSREELDAVAQTMRTDLKGWIGTAPNDPLNPVNEVSLSRILSPGDYTLILANHHDPEDPITPFARAFEFEITAAPAAVPIPAAAWLFGSALVGMLGFRRGKA